ncbi:MAG: hypothetical protein VX119_04265 [Bacteroidota bacterium]|nr:hypothetical protein [Bacteroidota bacterium]MEC8032474.1 hypothetical protein [Bacteroidota bacterium]MEC8756660.1 hypothetical protein [Bacteroidota bacterium]MEC9221578.1 hypothetical protein [Bacteroidota bacterium]
MLHKFCSFQLFVSLGLCGLLVLSSCQTNNENTKYLDEATLDLNQANVDSLRLDKKLSASLFSNSTTGSSRSSHYNPLITYRIPSNLLVNAGMDEMFFDVLDEQIEQISNQVGDSIQRVLSHYNYYFSEQAKESYQIAYRTSCYADWIGLSAPPSPRFSRVICLDDAQHDTATFLVNTEYYLPEYPLFLNLDSAMAQAMRSGAPEDLYWVESLKQNIYSNPYVLDYGFNPGNHLPLDIANALYMANYAQDSVARMMLGEAMVDAGKRLFFLECLLPEWADHKLIEYSKPSMDWCKEYEYDLWLMFNDSHYECDITSTSHFIHQKALSISSGTQSLGWVNLQSAPNAPDRIGEWIGWQIVRAYAEENGGYAALQSIIETPSSLILQQSPYNPQ